MYMGERELFVMSPKVKEIRKKTLTMESDKETTPALSRSDINRPGEYVLQTPLGLKRIVGTNMTGDFSRFENESRGTMKRLVSMEREMKFMKEVLEGIIGKCDILERENKEMKSRFQEYKHILEVNNEMKKELRSMKEENEVLKEKYGRYE